MLARGVPGLARIVSFQRQRYVIGTDNDAFRPILMQLALFSVRSMQLNFPDRPNMGSGDRGPERNYERKIKKKARKEASKKFMYNGENDGRDEESGVAGSAEFESRECQSVEVRV